MHFLITGANGFLGSALSHHLFRAGHTVRCLVRHGSDVESLKGLETHFFEGDVTKPDTLKRAVEGMNCVFHLAGVRRGATRDDFMAVNAVGTQNVCDALVSVNSRARFVLCGSLAATGPSFENRPRVEDDSPAPQEWYGESKAEAERIAFSYASRMPVTCARPARILGPGDKENLTFFKLVKKGVVLKLLGPPRPLSLIDVDDTVQLMTLLATHPAALGEAFFAAADGTLDVQHLMQLAADTLHWPTRTVPVPAPLLKSVGFVADLVTRATGKKLPVNRKLVRQLLAPGWTCSNEKAKRLLGFKPAWSLEDSIARSAKWYVEQGWL
ncbi:MAG: NAD-dependent epimerase/dehydratase family protein [Myxococcaceae bacterium]|nr:NAD-dependent epimerase/dehydratase family protein [Myxococcaceae bacterium]